MTQAYGQQYFENRTPDLKDFIMFVQWAAHTMPSSVFDYGCGTGKFVHIARFYGIRAMGYDPNTPQDQVFGLARGLVTNRKDLLERASVDLVTCIDVMEHMPDERTVDECLETIKVMCAKFAVFSITDLELWDRYKDATHTFCRTRTWWVNKLSQYFEVLPVPQDWAFKDQLYLCKKRTEEVKP